MAAQVPAAGSLKRSHKYPASMAAKAPPMENMKKSSEVTLPKRWSGVAACRFAVEITQL